jgi:acyl-CoA thioester hydrolase
MTDDRFDDGLHYCWETRVRFAETDAQGVVFYGEYVTYQDETFSQYLREIGFAWEEIEAADWDVHVVHTDVDYRSFAEFGDDLVCGIRVTAIRESSLDLEWRCRTPDGTVVAEGHLTHVAVRDGSSTRVPDAFRTAVVDFQATPPEPV